MKDTIVPKKIINSFVLGVFSAMGILFILGSVLAATVYNAGGGTITNLATPATDSDLADKSYVDAASVTWEGFTFFTHNGNHGGAFGNGGFNDECNDDYAGSHACTYEEIIKLDSSISYANDFWVIDGSETRHDAINVWQMTKDGRTGNNINGNYPMCNGWTKSTTSYEGPVMDTQGYLTLEPCSYTNYIPCCS